MHFSDLSYTIIMNLLLGLTKRGVEMQNTFVSVN